MHGSLVIHDFHAYQDTGIPSRLPQSTLRDAVHLPPIARLPPELLIMILESSLDIGAYNSERIFRTIALSHVCTDWRNIMLDTARFWTLIDLRYRIIGQEFCSRSRGSSVRVTFTQNFHTDVPAILAAASQWIPAHIRRVEGIFLSASQAAIRTIVSLFDVASAELKNLVDGFESRTVSGPTFLVELRDGNLRRVCFDSVSLTGWDKSHFLPATLTSLTLSQIRSETSPSVAQVISILQRCPRLEEVVLLSALPPNPVDDNHADDLSVDLPQLRLLEVSSGVKAVIANLLSHLSLPPTTTIYLHCHGAKDLSVVLPSNLSQLRTFIAYQLLNNQPSVLLQVSSSWIAFVNHAGSQYLSSVHFAISPQDLSHILANFSSLIAPLSCVSTLQAIAPPHRSMSSITEVVWRSALSCMPRLPNLEAGGPWLRPLLSALCSVSNATLVQDTPTPSTVLCSELKTVRIVDRWRDGLETSRILENLEHCLSARMRVLGGPLEFLILETTQEPTRAAVARIADRLKQVARTVVTCDGGLVPLVSNCVG